MVANPPVRELEWMHIALFPGLGGNNPGDSKEHTLAS
jgi:hypothetical protein